MKRILAGLGLFLSASALYMLYAFGIAAIAPAVDASPIAEEEVKNLERQRQDWFVHGDIAALDEQTAEDYTTVNVLGRMSTKPQMMASLRAGRTKVLSVTLDELKARVYGDTAVLTGVYRDAAVTDGVKKEGHARFIRIFVRQNGRWVAVAYQQTAAAN